MNVENIFLSVNARDFAAQSDWWATVLERSWDREPMPSCHEWDMREGVFFQVLDNPEGAGLAVVSLRITDLDAQVERLRGHGVTIADPVKVEGFETLRYASIRDPEGNEVDLLEGA